MAKDSVKAKLSKKSAAGLTNKLLDLVQSQRKEARNGSQQTQQQQKDKYNFYIKGPTKATGSVH